MVGSRVFSKVASRQVRHVTPVSDPPPGSLLEAVYVQAAGDMRVVIPPVLMHSPSPTVLAAFWSLLRETLVADGGPVDRLAKEVAAAAVSVANLCPYCVDMHTTGIYDLATERDAEAIGTDHLDDVEDAVTRANASWARYVHVPRAAQPPLAPAAVPELLGVAVTFHYLNRMVNVFLSSNLLSPRLRGAARRRIKRGVSHLLRPVLRRKAYAGAALPLRPEAPHPDDLRWARGTPSVAAAFARSAAQFEAAGLRSLPEPVRRLVRAELDAWHGEEPGISRSWCEDAVAALAPDDRPAGRLALLTALASYQIDDDVVAAFRARHPDDGTLVDATAWASFAAARLIGARAYATMGQPTKHE